MDEHVHAHDLPPELLAYVLLVLHVGPKQRLAPLLHPLLTLPLRRWDGGHAAVAGARNGPSTGRTRIIPRNDRSCCRGRGTGDLPCLGLAHRRAHEAVPVHWPRGRVVRGPGVRPLRLAGRRRLPPLFGDWLHSRFKVAGRGGSGVRDFGGRRGIDVVVLRDVVDVHAVAQHVQEQGPRVEGLAELVDAGQQLLRRASSALLLPAQLQLLQEPVQVLGVLHPVQFGGARRRLQSALLTCRALQVQRSIGLLCSALQPCLQVHDHLLQPLFCFGGRLDDAGNATFATHDHLLQLCQKLQVLLVRLECRLKGEQLGADGLLLPLALLHEQPLQVLQRRAATLHKALQGLQHLQLGLVRLLPDGRLLLGHEAAAFGVEGAESVQHHRDQPLVLTLGLHPERITCVRGIPRMDLQGARQRDGRQLQPAVDELLQLVLELRLQALILKLHRLDSIRHAGLQPVGLFGQVIRQVLKFPMPHQHHVALQVRRSALVLPHTHVSPLLQLRLLAVDVQRHTLAVGDVQALQPVYHVLTQPREHLLDIAVQHHHLRPTRCPHNVQELPRCLLPSGGCRSLGCGGCFLLCLLLLKGLFGGLFALVPFLFGGLLPLLALLPVAGRLPRHLNRRRCGLGPTLDRQEIHKVHPLQLHEILLFVGCECGRHRRLGSGHHPSNLLLVAALHVKHLLILLERIRHQAARDVGLASLGQQQLLHFLLVLHLEVSQSLLLLLTEHVP
mmetsp:Transcript_32558/g.54569  ORF Transcript_32558/g.54569 Transcript_32558/m.54569 type:complete len:728 (+) Transcript_32558:3419-5602(+)